MDTSKLLVQSALRRDKNAFLSLNKYFFDNNR